MSSVADAYDQWAGIYDSNKNRTRDLEALSLRSMLSGIRAENCLETGCGTGKNTEWLISICNRITALDLSVAMLEKAKEKIDSSKVTFVQADITEDWSFAGHRYDLATFSLVLEHIEDLEPVVATLKQHMQSGGYVYVGELHPFKQYSGTKARFDGPEGQQIVPCFNHHVSEFYQAFRNQGFELVDLKEWFDEDNKEIPRILSLLFRFTGS